MVSSRTAASGRPHLTSLMYPSYSLPVRRLKDLLSHVVPDATLGTVEDLPSTQLPRLYTLTMSDNRKFVLSFAPSLAVRLLRSEATILSSEATLVYFVSGSDPLPMASTESSQEQVEPGSPFKSLAELVPKLLKHSANNREMAYPYSIFELTPGSPLSTLSVYLSLSDRRLIDKQVGSMARKLASLTSPNSTFGTVCRVLPDPFTPGSAITPLTTGSKTWAEGFNTLLEGILRDGEDLSVLLPYDVVRAHYRRLSWALDAVTLPRLVILDVGDANVMVERGSDEGTVPSSSKSRSVSLTGLRDWSQGVFGDPLISSSFEDPSDGFLEGWREGIAAAADEDIIQDPGNAALRQLLYRCYRAIVAVVTEYYRPQGDSSRRELEGRRKLTTALAELEKVDEEVTAALKRARSMSSMDERPKRQKLEGEEGRE